MKKLIFGLLSVLLLAIAPAKAVPTDEITELINRQQQAWNQGNIDAYMLGYWHDPKLRFVSKSEFKYGWDKMLAAYKRSYPDRAAMGQLKLELKDVQMLSNYSALVAGRWVLLRQKDSPSGVFTLLLEKKDDHWVITHDHSS
ncbi:YybH family protein [Shewanella chilikensis]|uniref:YybH family protein n=1 Tax=Shewanella chilikensis TaxID=558541 RepID=UPI00399B047C